MNVSRDDQLAAHRVPPQLMGIIPNNTGGFGDANKAAQVFDATELESLRVMMTSVNEWIGEEVIRFKPYAGCRHTLINSNITLQPPRWRSFARDLRPTHAYPMNLKMHQPTPIARRCDPRHACGLGVVFMQMHDYSRSSLSGASGGRA